eukprot:1146172-Pelagomonas_calceolata.AAC.1
MIDVIGHYTHLPNNMEHAFLAAAFGLQVWFAWMSKGTYGSLQPSVLADRVVCLGLGCGVPRTTSRVIRREEPAAGSTLHACGSACNLCLRAAVSSLPQLAKQGWLFAFSGI